MKRREETVGETNQHWNDPWRARVGQLCFMAAVPVCVCGLGLHMLAFMAPGDLPTPAGWRIPELAVSVIGLVVGQAAFGSALAAILIGKILTGAIRVENFRSFELWSVFYVMQGLGIGLMFAAAPMCLLGRFGAIEDQHAFPPLTEFVLAGVGGAAAWFAGRRMKSLRRSGR